MSKLFEEFRTAMNDCNGNLLSQCITPINPSYDSDRLQSFYEASDASGVETDIRYEIIYHRDIDLPKDEKRIWLDIFVLYWKAVAVMQTSEDFMHTGIATTNWNKVYVVWKEVANAVLQGFQKEFIHVWAIPCLYVVGKYLRVFAIKADRQFADLPTNGFQNALLNAFGDLIGKHDNLEDSARQINRIFSLCIGDRNSLDVSRKWAIYYTANLLFKTYFKLSSFNLAKNILKSFAAAKDDLPPLGSFPKAQQVTFLYHAGIVYCIEEDYSKAEEHLFEAFRQCHKDAHRNKELILTYLIPIHLLTSHQIPSAALLASYPRIQSLLGPIITAVRQGDLKTFDATMRRELVNLTRLRIFLTVERSRDILIRNLIRKVYLLGGYEDLREGQTEADRVLRSRIPISEIQAALHFSLGYEEDMLDSDEVEQLLANMIYKNHMKGYIARDRGILVLNKKGAFPGTGA
ncbi:hypothetical protein M501DRAFT_1003989 [Patellaria atrata CBS 101060]|uniref:PCI domain-containing protein n=1 Tax=Patellaria atrata CBS 101060 TaxID=1346257 RepID=A0A9P4VQ23_9PEZI|nr:hypothetical protein M501DRAFT_1003989 [Patellaria atrata CBS 101060]